MKLNYNRLKSITKLGLVFRKIHNEIFDIRQCFTQAL
jgi:hypothetical protein